MTTLSLARNACQRILEGVPSLFRAPDYQLGFPEIGVSGGVGWADFLKDEWINGWPGTWSAAGAVEWGGAGESFDSRRRCDRFRRSR